MIGVNVIAADTDTEAAKLATSLFQQFLNIIRGRTGLLQPPVDNMDEVWSPEEKAALSRQLAFTVIGGPSTIKEKLQEIADLTQADEMIVGAQIYDHEARLRSYEILAEVVGIK